MSSANMPATVAKSLADSASKYLRTTASGVVSTVVLSLSGSCWSGPILTIRNQLLQRDYWMDVPRVTTAGLERARVDVPVPHVARPHRQQVDGDGGDRAR